MKISASWVNMSSGRQYEQIDNRGKDSSYKISEKEKDNYSFGNNNFLNTYESFAGKNIAGNDLEKISPLNNEGILNKITPFQNQSLRALMERLMSGGVFGSRMGINPLVSYSEYESTSFHADGRAVTEDGRTIDFNIDVQMTRSYAEYMDVQFKSLPNALMDPLIINVDNGIADISDQKFLFDLDADGNEEQISMLGAGCGFLALDKNDDGIINDGRELFGTATGDGFGELRNYDEDGNGWIDENDSVFSKLKVWCKAADGSDILMDLKEAGVGAIFLGDVSTEFSMNSMLNDTNGVIRSTGFFLKEDGGAGTMHNIDLATSPEKPKYSDSPANNVNQTNYYYMEMYTGYSRKIEGVDTKESETVNKIDTKTRHSDDERVDRTREAKERFELQRERRKARTKAVTEKQIEQARKRHEWLEKVYEDNLKNKEMYNDLMDDLEVETDELEHSELSEAV